MLYNTYMEQVELSQDELKYIVSSFNQLIKGGGLMLGDIQVIYPLVEKLKVKIKPEPSSETPRVADLVK